MDNSSADQLYLHKICVCICEASKYIFVKVTPSYFLRLAIPSCSRVVAEAAAPYLRWIPTKQLPLTHLTSTWNAPLT